MKENALDDPCEQHSDIPQFIGERAEISLRNLGKITTGNTPSKKNKEYWTAKDIPFIKPNDIEEAAVTFLEKGTEYVSESASGKARLVGDGAVLVTCIGTIAKIAVVKCRRIAFNQQINAVEVDKDVVDPIYLAYALKANSSRLKALANAPVVPIINKKQFESFAMLVHVDLDVQRYIASRRAQQEKTLNTAQHLQAHRQIPVCRDVWRNGILKSKAPGYGLVSRRTWCQKVSVHQ